MAKHEAKRPLSELECFVLGLVWQLGPSSPYAVRRHMQDSPSTQWSASAGAIYPLMRRLEREKLLQSSARRTGERKGRAYRISPKGRAVLKAWIGPEFSEEVITPTHDPLRSRARFLGLLTPAQQRAWVQAAANVLDEIEARVEAWHVSQRELLGTAADVMTRSGRRDVASRKAWLNDVKKLLGKNA